MVQCTVQKKGPLFLSSKENLPDKSVFSEGDLKPSQLNYTKIRFAGTLLVQVIKGKRIFLVQEKR